MTPAQTPPVAESVEQVNYAREALSRQQAEQIVAARIDEWGWGPLSEADGCAEHELAVKACQAGLASAYEAGRAEGVRAAAEVAEGFDDPNRDWLRRSVWDEIKHDTAQRIRALSK